MFRAPFYRDRRYRKKLLKYVISKSCQGILLGRQRGEDHKVKKPTHFQVLRLTTFVPMVAIGQQKFNVK